MLCELLVKARVSQNFTQKDVAKSIRRPQSFVSKYENAERRLDVVEFLEVADALGIDAKSLLADIEAL